MAPLATPQITSFDYGKDWFFGTPGSPAVIGGAFDVSGKLVFAGNGWVIRKTNADPYKGIDVRGKIIVIAGKPPELGAGSLGEACVDFFSPQQYAAKNGALAVVNIADSMNAAFMSQAEQRPRSPQRPSVRGQEIPAASIRLPLRAYHYRRSGIHQRAVRRRTPQWRGGLLHCRQECLGLSAFVSGRTQERAHVSNPSRLTTARPCACSMAVQSEDGHGENVIGILEGSDPVLKNEYVILSAHLDHLGLSAPLPDGHAVYNGADDDGSGSAGLLAVARAYAMGAAKGIRPKRSILFLWNGGEEKSYAGSRYFVQFPPIDLSKVVAFLHMDMIGRTKNPTSVDTDKTHVLVDRGRDPADRSQHQQRRPGKDHRNRQRQLPEVEAEPLLRRHTSRRNP